MSKSARISQKAIFHLQSPEEKKKTCSVASYGGCEGQNTTFHKTKISEMCFLRC